MCPIHVLVTQRVNQPSRVTKSYSFLQVLICALLSLFVAYSSEYEPSPWFHWRLSDNAVNVLGHLHGSKAVIMGELYSPKEALEINLVDELCDSDQLLSRANERMAEWLTLPGKQVACITLTMEYFFKKLFSVLTLIAQARSLTKSRVRRKTVRDMLAEREDDVKSVVRNISSDAFQSGLKLYMESLRKKKGWQTLEYSLRMDGDVESLAAD